MLESWRWFGPKDTLTIPLIRQTGASEIVSALHGFEPGEVWPLSQIEAHQKLVERDQNGRSTGLSWSVVESLPVSEEIKRQSGDFRVHFENYRESLRNLAKAGINIVCYNFMPVLDWTRTDLAYELSGGARCMRFDLVDFIAFDLFILQRAGAEYDAHLTDEAKSRFAHMSDARKSELARNVVFGLPGAASEMSMQDVREHLALYADMSADLLRANLFAFLEEVAPLAQELGLRLCCHPDDPPFSLLGLPRIASSESDYRAIVEAVDLPSNGITFCTGSLGVSPENDLAGMVDRLGAHIHFLHLRNVVREDHGLPTSFYESGHISGSVDMISVIEAVLREEKRRRVAGRGDHQIPFRPDHGLDMADDKARAGQPGYPLIGRQVGLAELRGVIAGLQHPKTL